MSFEMSGERSGRPPSLVEHDRLRIAEQIEAAYTYSETANEHILPKACVLLETNPGSLAYTMIACGYSEQGGGRRLVQAARQDNAGSSYGLDKTQLLHLNNHPYIRTVCLNDLVVALDASGPVLRSVVQNIGMDPAMPKGITPSATGRGLNQERFNKDQIVELQEAVRQQTAPPEGVIASERVGEMLGISIAALERIKQTLHIKDTWYRDPVSSEGKPYISPHAAAKVVRFVKDPEYRRKITASGLSTTEE